MSETQDDDKRSQIHRAIQASYLTQGLSEAHLDLISERAVWHTFSLGTEIVRQHDNTRDLMILAHGSAEILTVVGEPIGLIRAGMPIGEVSFLDGKPRSGTVIAKTTCGVVVLAWQPLMSLLKSEPEMASRCLWNVSQVLCSRLRTTNQHLAALMAIEESQSTSVRS